MARKAKSITTRELPAVFHSFWRDFFRIRERLGTGFKKYETNPDNRRVQLPQFVQSQKWCHTTSTALPTSNNTENDIDNIQSYKGWSTIATSSITAVGVHWQKWQLQILLASMAWRQTTEYYCDCRVQPQTDCSVFELHPIGL